MIQASTALLLAMIVHLGGVDIDSFEAARLQWYRDARLQTEWVRRGDLQTPSVYHFSDGEELVLVERLLGTEHTYAVVQYDHHDPSPSAQPRATAIVSLRSLAQQLRPAVAQGTTLEIDSGPVVMSWTAGDVADTADTEPAAEDAEADAGPAEGGLMLDAAPGPTPVEGASPLVLTRRQDSLSIAHPASQQVLVLIIP